MVRRREFIGGLGGAAAAWPLAAHAQRPALPVVALVNDRSADAGASSAAAFRKGLGETGYVEGRNVTVEYHWLEGQYDRLPALMAELVRRRVAVIATPGGGPAARAAKAATATIPIVFGAGENAVELGLVASLARPGGNATGINFFNSEVTAKRLGLLHELVPKAVRVAVLVNPASFGTERTLRAIEEAAAPSACKSRSSTPPRAARSMRPLPLLRMSVPMPSSSKPMHSSGAAACNLRTWRRAIGFRRRMGTVILPKSAG
jgi:putative ABC transport system substrate-binding protein